MNNWYTGCVAEHYSRHPNTFCSLCKIPIYRRPKELKDRAGVAYCSMVCYGLSCRKEQPCIVCGVFILAGMNKKTCSRACANKNRSGSTYKGRPLKDKVTTSRVLKAKIILERGAKCERCGFQSERILQVHHKDRDRSNNNMANLELICPNCHCEEHYGRIG